MAPLQLPRETKPLPADSASDVRFSEARPRRARHPGGRFELRGEFSRCRSGANRTFGARFLSQKLTQLTHHFSRKQLFPSRTGGNGVRFDTRLPSRTPFAESGSTRYAAAPRARHGQRHEAAAKHAFSPNQKAQPPSKARLQEFVIVMRYAEPIPQGEPD